MKNVERRLPIVGARTSSKYVEVFKSSMRQLMDGIGDIDKNNCILDLVENGRTYTLEETGDMLNITRERVRQIESKAKAKVSLESTKDMQNWEEHERNQQ